MFKNKLLKAIDNLIGYEEKLAFLHAQFLKAKTRQQEKIILEMIESLKFFGN